MSILFNKGITQVLSEACKSEGCVKEFDELDDELFDELEELEELDVDIIYTAEMVNVIEEQTEYGRRFLVEYDNLAKLMESHNVDEKEALEKVCECNLISYEDTYLVIESSDILEEAINEAKCAKSSNKPLIKAKASKKLKDSAKALKNIKNKGIKVLMKKSKKR